MAPNIVELNDMWESRNIGMVSIRWIRSFIVEGFKVGIAQQQGGFDDFTVASSWERLISDIEAVCRKWQTAVTHGCMATGAVIVDGHRMLYAVHNDFAYVTKNYRLELFFEVDGHGGADDWRGDAHFLQVWFGVKDFLVIAPISMSGVVLDAPEATFLLSAVAIALSNCGSVWPAFVPVHDPSRKAYKGIQGLKGPYCRSFDADRIGTQVPVKLMHLEGLYDLLVTKLTFSLPDSVHEFDGKVRFTMRLTYHTPMPGFECVQEEGSSSPSAKPIENYDADAAAKAQWDEDCPWADWYSVDDPIKGFELITIWASRLIESSIDMAEFENVSTMEADKWSLAPIIAKNLEDFDYGEEVSFASRLRALLDAFTFSKEAKFMEDFAAGEAAVMQKIESSTAVPPPGVLDHVLKDLFQDGRLELSSSHSSHEHARAIKGAPPGSLFSQYCLHALWFGTCNIRAISILWMEFVREVRWCWDELQPLPRMPCDGLPDFDTCVVHQKLQLLGACIKRKRAESHSHPSKNIDFNGDDLKISASNESDDDQTFHQEQARDDNVQLASNLLHRQGSSRSGSEMMLLKSREKLCIPITQESPIMTEDMLLEREHAILALGDSPSGRMTRARLQTDVLTSDMAAFKAANPAAVFEDFVRWHSPRDWIEDDYFKDSLETLSLGGENFDEETISWPPRGKLSERMLDPESFWHELWITVEPVPASAQKPLFDHTREGEKVIHYLETLRPHQLLAQMICTAFGSVADILCKAKVGDLKSLKLEIDKLCLTSIAILKPLYNISISDKELEDFLEDWCTDITSLCALLEKTEKHVIMAASFHQKLNFTPRLSAALFTNYTSSEKQANNSSKATLQQTVTMSERDIIASLFPPLGLDYTWKKSLRMGNFLNGHEPLTREIIFSHFDHYSHDQTERYRMEHSDATEHLLSHRMYIQGTSNDLQVAYSVISND